MPDIEYTGDRIRSRYDALAADGKLDPDPAQQVLASRFDALNEEIAKVRLAAKSSSLGWLFAKRAPKPELVKGLYVHGGVGRGKTMLMDFFFRACPAQRKRRAHFHDFMADVHDRVARHRADLKQGKVKEDDPIPPVARAIAGEARVLCFDEFSVTDIADAMILSRLFSALFDNRVVLVATSNVAPDDLYRDGLNRSLFLPFVDTLKAHVDVVSLDSDRDYRLDRLSKSALYVSPLNGEARAAIEDVWERMTAGTAARAETIEVKGRTIAVPAAALGAARFDFGDLCEKPLGARDYLAICRNYHTIFLENVPVIGDGKRNEAKRFINLIDTLYDNKTRLVVSADAEPTELYQAKSGTEAFEFDRTASRLIEMRSGEWVKGVEAEMTARIATVTLVVPDYDEAIAFYCGALGFELLEDARLSDTKRWVRVVPSGGGAALLLAKADGEEQEAAIGSQCGGRVAFFLETDDFARDHRAFEEAGVQFLEEPRRENYGTVAVFADPYGNMWDLIQPAA